ncbi:TRAP transporter small permease subunit [Bradyrhizobium sp. TZ2]
MTSISTLPRRLPPPPYLAVIRTIDRFTTWTGYLFVLLIFPLVFANVYEVFARYFLRSPTVWALDVTTMSYAALFMLGSALALLKGAHVRTDILWEGFSDRTKGMIDSLAFILFFLPTMAVLFYISIDDFLYSISIDERSSSGAWTPILWPLRGLSRSPPSCCPAGHLGAHEEPVGVAHR